MTDLVYSRFDVLLLSDGAHIIRDKTFSTMLTRPSRQTLLVGRKQSNDHVSVPASPTFPPLHSTPAPHMPRKPTLFRARSGCSHVTWYLPHSLLQARDMPRKARILRRFEPRRSLYAITRSLTVRGVLHRGQEKL